MHRDPNVKLNSLQVAEMGKLVEAYFASIHQGVTVNGYDIAFDDGTHGGLGNLAQTLAATDREEWKTAIAHHFETLANSPERPPSWEAAAPMVRLRLYPADFFPPEHQTVKWPVTDDLVAVLMLDSPESATSVPEMELVDWHVKPELAFDRALHNSLELEATEKSSQDVGNGTMLQFLSGDFYTSAHVLVLERHLDEAPHGAVLSIPNRHVVLFHAIKDLSVVPLINTMILTTSNLYDQGPGSISPLLYWWRRSELIPMQAGFDGSSVQFTPPDEFVELLNELAPAEPEKPKKRGLFRRGSE